MHHEQDVIYNINNKSKLSDKENEKFEDDLSMEA